MIRRNALAGVAMMLIPCSLALFSAGCGMDGGDLVGTVVKISLKEYSVTPEVTTTTAGTISFRVHNDGAVAHEFLVIRTDLAPDALPRNADGSYEENGPETDVLDSIEEINPGNTSVLAITLEAGNYVLICNMVHQGIAHYSRGMRTAFTVSEASGG